MARPSKSVKTMSKNLTKEEIKSRLESEENLRGEADKISPPSHLNERQMDIFNNIVDELQASGILGNLDIYILSSCSISIDRIQEIEKMINEKPGLLMDKDLRMANTKYSNDFFRTCNELSLSPQSRAKVGNINLQSKKEKADPLLKLLKGDKK